MITRNSREGSKREFGEARLHEVVDSLPSTIFIDVGSGRRRGNRPRKVGMLELAVEARMCVMHERDLVHVD
jgi:hypothetical protein